MKTKNIGGDPVKRFAGLQIDFWTKYKKDQIINDQIEAFLKLSKKERDYLVECMQKGVNPFSGGKSKKRIASRRALRYLISHAVAQIPEVTEFETRAYYKQGKNGTTKIFMMDKFEKTILNQAPGVITLAPMTLEKFKLSQSMNDSEMLAELGNPEPYSISQALGILKDLTSKQPEGDDGTLLTDGYANIFYVNVGVRTVAVNARWNSWQSIWYLYCCELGVWREGFICFFFFFNDTATTEIYTLSLHDALPI